MNSPALGTTAALARRAAEELLQKPDISSRAAAAAVSTLIAFWEAEAAAGRGATYAGQQWDAAIMMLQEARKRYSDLYARQPL